MPVRPQRGLPNLAAEQILVQPDLREPMGVRDRAILERYSTGMRRTELLRLGIYDIDMEKETVLIRECKGHKSRVVPIGERALAWIEK